MEKYFANKGVPRHKKPLNNIVYEIELSQLKNIDDKTKYEQYKFKDEGYLVLFWWYEEKNPIKNWHGFIEAKVFKTKTAIFGNYEFSDSELITTWKEIHKEILEGKHGKGKIVN